MNAEEIEKDLIDLIRTSLLHGSSRPISLDEPLGGQGIGLDSLAIVEFVAAFEQRFDITVPDSMWTGQGQWAGRDFVSLVIAPPASGTRTVRVPPDQNAVRLSSNLSNFEKASLLLREEGVVPGIASILGRSRNRLLRNIYSFENFVLLAKELDEPDRFRDHVGSEYLIRFATEDDRSAFGGLWPPALAVRKGREFTRRLSAGYYCLSAWKRTELVGVDWLSGTGDQSEETGLLIQTRHGSCYAMELIEKYPGHGIGVALLAASLLEAANLGFQRQVTYIKSDNHRMLAAAIQLVGFRTFGTIELRRMLSLPFPRWKIDGGWTKERRIVL